VGRSFSTGGRKKRKVNCRALAGRGDSKPGCQDVGRKLWFFFDQNEKGEKGFKKKSKKFRTPGGGAVHGGKEWGGGTDVRRTQKVQRVLGAGERRGRETPGERF